MKKLLLVLLALVPFFAKTQCDNGTNYYPSTIGIPPVDSWGWDGTINGGGKAVQGTYYYILDLKGVNGDNFSEKGTVTLLR